MKSVPLKILLIEDSPSDATLFNALLQRVVEFSFEMDHAENLDSGISKLKGSSYDAIVLDLGLPDSVGIKTYETVREHAEDVPIIILTGNDDQKMLVQAMKKGADNYLLKDVYDGNRIAISILSAMRNRSRIMQGSEESK